MLLGFNRTLNAERSKQSSVKWLEHKMAELVGVQFFVGKLFIHCFKRR